MANDPPQRLEGDAAWSADRELVARVLRGDPRARFDLVERLACVPAMVRALNAQNGARLSEDELEDVVQETLSALWTKLATFEGRSRLESWTYRFASNEVLKALERRRRAHRAADVDLDLRAQEPMPEGELIEDAHVQACLERLTDEYALVVRLKHYHDLTFEEIAVRVGSPSNTVKARYYRGLERLKEALMPRWRKELR